MEVEGKERGRGVEGESEEKKRGQRKREGGEMEGKRREDWRGKRTEKLHWRNLVLRVHYVKDTKFIVALW